MGVIHGKRNVQASTRDNQSSGGGGRYWPLVTQGLSTSKNIKQKKPA